MNNELKNNYLVILNTRKKSESDTLISIYLYVNEDKKIRIAMKSSEQYPMEGTVHVDEFVVGGKETFFPFAFDTF